MCPRLNPAVCHVLFLMMATAVTHQNLDLVCIRSLPSKMIAHRDFTENPEILVRNIRAILITVSSLEKVKERGPVAVKSGSVSNVVVWAMQGTDILLTDAVIIR